MHTIHTKQQGGNHCVFYLESHLLNSVL
ncbi:hypothetical protein EG68_09003 [Paragonimus skrjabini miyazakii]|uniref:Uncharacterized protein n=1 Tax=Paragonimus skrjabini miyazakii TaxID=59628 RepID=A0A8S9YP26_9TREM|nr:hypothetical protein EG68_09003 [Paragonimus skrjabini miyazakii]